MSSRQNTERYGSTPSHDDILYLCGYHDASPYATPEGTIAVFPLKRTSSSSTNVKSDIALQEGENLTAHGLGLEVAANAPLLALISQLTDQYAPVVRRWSKSNLGDWREYEAQIYSSVWLSILGGLVSSMRSTTGDFIYSSRRMAEQTGWMDYWHALLPDLTPDELWDSCRVQFCKVVLPAFQMVWGRISNESGLVGSVAYKGQKFPMNIYRATDLGLQLLSLAPYTVAKADPPGIVVSIKGLTLADSVLKPEEDEEEVDKRYETPPTYLGTLVNYLKAHKPEAIAPATNPEDATCENKGIALK